MTDLFKTLDKPVQNLIREAADTIIMPAFRQPLEHEMICIKNDHSIVTQTDLIVQEFMQQKLQLLLPDATFLGEEGLSDPSDHLNTLASEWVWIIDPIDGTHNFACQNKNFGTMVSLWHNESGQPLYGWIYMPVDDVMYSGGKDQGVFRNDQKLVNKDTRKHFHEMAGLLNYNSFHPMNDQVKQNLNAFATVDPSSCAAMKFAAMFEGNADFSAFGRAKIWDLSAGFALLKALGGHAECINGAHKNLILKDDSCKSSWYLAVNQKESFTPIRDRLFQGMTFQPA